MLKKYRKIRVTHLWDITPCDLLDVGKVFERKLLPAALESVKESSTFETAILTRCHIPTARNRYILNKYLHWRFLSQIMIVMCGN